MASAEPNPSPSACTADSAASWNAFKDRMLDDFRQWLDQLDDVYMDRLEAGQTNSEPSLDLFALQAALCALRQDIQIGAKTSRGLRDEVRTLAVSVQDNLAGASDKLVQTAATMGPAVPDTRAQAHLAVVREFLKLCEGLERCLDSIARIRPRKPRRKRQKKIIAALKQPLELLLTKTHHSLERLDIKPFARVGDAFDPKTMCAIAVDEDSGHPAGIVTGICQQGYTVAGELVQTAEVKVQK